MDDQLKNVELLKLIAINLKDFGIKPTLQRVYSILYLAERKHLNRFGLPIVEDGFFATQEGVLPVSLTNNVIFEFANQPNLDCVPQSQLPRHE